MPEVAGSSPVGRPIPSPESNHGRLGLSRLRRARGRAPVHRPGLRVAGGDRDPFHRARAGGRRRAFLALCRRGRRDHRRAAPVTGHELQERDGRASARRRQGRDPGGQTGRDDLHRPAPGVRPRGPVARRPLRHGRGRRHVRGADEGHRRRDALRLRPAGGARRSGRRPRPVHRARRLSGGQGGGEARAWRHRHEGRAGRDPGRRFGRRAGLPGCSRRTARC